jgi:primosomal protein N' (replication factor Y)
MIARVTLELALRKEFDYLIPPELTSLIEVGTRVQVPFGPRKVLGCVTGLAEQSDVPRLKPILKVIGAQSLVTPEVIRLARWMAEYYCCPPETALKSVLPEAVRNEQAGWQEQLYVQRVDDPTGAPRLPKRQAEVLQIVDARREMLLTELLKEARTTSATVRRLEDRGLITIAPRVVERDPYARESIVPSNPLPLNASQQSAFERIQSCIRAVDSERSPGPKASPPNPSTFLLHGVTGSGKTEVYLQAIAAAFELGKGAIVLVPEISLTPQTVERFKARFSHGPHKTLVAVLHSHLSSGERHDEWHKIRQGRARIVIGARSAVFAPVAPLGLIVVDEEHEHTYKQEEAPRYHARDLAVMRGQMEGAVVVLGSATPSLESYYNAQRGKYTLLELTERADGAKMPHIRVVDMRQAVRKNGGVPVFSPQLKDAITQRLELGEQTILFLNRRGYSSFLECPLCGYVAQCPNCSVALTFHRAEQNLACHICGHLSPVPATCPNERCRNPRIRYAGLGTERVEDTLTKLFPKARVRRMDSDVMKRKEDYRRVLGDFRTGKIDILVGTQMIAKGLHFPT